MKKEQLTIAKIVDKIKKYEKTGEVCATNFLDPAESIDVEPVVRKYSNCFFGGYENAERKILIIGSDKADIAKDYIEIVTIESNKPLSHREILGSLLGLGINRDVIGDILINGLRADVFIIKEISKYVIQNLEKIGREKIKIYKNSYENLIEVKNTFKEIKTTVASLRLDAIISASTGLSREVSSKLIENEKVKINYKVITNSSKQIKEGDKISVRGYGRIELSEILGETKKERIRVIIKKSCN